MNKKGYTLVEVIVSIMILSITSITLAGSFTTIIHFMTKSNEVKEASNDMYALIEGKESGKSASIKSSRTLNYGIYKQGDKDKNVLVNCDGSYEIYKSSLTDDVTLSYISKEEIISLEENEDYKKMMGEDGFVAFKLFIESSESRCSNKKNYQKCIIEDIKNTSNFKHTEFLKKFLPNDKLGIVPSLYIDVIYPFDGDERLYFVNMNINDETNNNTKIFLFYDEKEEKWYFFNDAPSLSKFNIKITNGGNWKRDIYYNDKIINSYDEFIKLVKEEKDNFGKSKWLELHPENKYKEGDTSNIWVHIKETN